MPQPRLPLKISKKEKMIPWHRISENCIKRRYSSLIELIRDETGRPGKREFKVYPCPECVSSITGEHYYHISTRHLVSQKTRVKLLDAVLQEEARLIKQLSRNISIFEVKLYRKFEIIYIKRTKQVVVIDPLVKP